MLKWTSIGREEPCQRRNFGDESFDIPEDISSVFPGASSYRLVSNARRSNLESLYNYRINPLYAEDEWQKSQSAESTAPSLSSGYGSSQGMEIEKSNLNVLNFQDS